MQQMYLCSHYSQLLSQDGYSRERIYERTASISVQGALVSRTWTSCFGLFLGLGPLCYADQVLTGPFLPRSQPDVGPYLTKRSFTAHRPWCSLVLLQLLLI